MEDIDHIAFNFDPRIGLLVSIMVGFLVFAVSLDLTWEKLLRVIKKPKGPVIGLIAQFLLLPMVAFIVGIYMIENPAVFLGLLLVACCPAGALSNYLTGIAHGDVATSISMTAISTLFSILLTPVLFTFWASLNPGTLALLETITMDPAKIMLTLLIMLVIPVTAGVFIRAWHPVKADRWRRIIRPLAGGVFITVVALIIGSNFQSLTILARNALVPVISTFIIAVGLGWGLSFMSRLGASERRAVAIEVAFQNVALAIGLSITFFPGQGALTAVSILWGIIHLTLGSTIALSWSKIPLTQPT